MDQKKTMAKHKTHQDILDFWFGPEDSEAFTKPQEKWFKKDPQFDEAIRENFAPLLEAFKQGSLDAWRADPWGALALILLLDQFPRNLFRGSDESFAYDGTALALAKEALEKGFDQEVPPVQRVFYYLPFEHSEVLEDQERSVKLFEVLEKDLPGFLTYAQQHYDIIKRFGRFPHRNVALGRVSTPEEEAFLKTPGSSF